MVLVEGIDSLRLLRYVVLEEIVDGVVTLLAWKWPMVDSKGRLFWPAEDPLEISIASEVLHQQLYAAARFKRTPRPGDTFAGQPGRLPDHSSSVEDLRPLFPDGLYDLSAEAHQAAKLAYQGSLSATREARERTDKVLQPTGRLPHVRLAPPSTKRAQT